MKKKLLSILGICIVLALFYQEILLVSCKIALNCFLPKTFSYQKISWDKNVLQIQGLIKEKNELSVDSIDLFYQEGAFHIRILHPQCLSVTNSRSQNILGTLLGLSRFFSVEVQHGVLELHQLRYYFSLLPIGKKLELKLAMDPDPLYPALLTLHYSPSNRIDLSIASQELKHLIPLAYLAGYSDRDLNYQAKMSIDANAIVHPNGYIQDMHVKTAFTNVKAQHKNKQFFCDQIKAELSAEKVYLKDLWHSFKGNLQLQNGSYALLSQNLEWQNQLVNIEVDLWLTDQSKGVLNAIAVDKNTTFPFLLETTLIHRDQQGIKIETAFSDPLDKSMLGSLAICQGQENVIECDIQKMENKHLNWALSCFALPQIDLLTSCEWKNCSAKMTLPFSNQVLQSINIIQCQIKDLWMDHSSHKFFIKDAQMQGKWDVGTSQITEGFCHLEKAEGLDIVIKYPGVENAICAHIQGDLSTKLPLSWPTLPLTTDLRIYENKLEVAGSILNMPFSAETMLLKPLFSLEKGLNLELIQGYAKLEDLTEEQYQPWIAKFLPELTVKGSYQLECLFDTDKLVIGIEGDKIHLGHSCKVIDIPKITELSLQYQEGKWRLSCPRLEGTATYEEEAYLFSTTLDAAYPQFHLPNFFLKTSDFSIQANLMAQYQDLLNLQLQITEIKREKKSLIRTPFLAEMTICPESRIDLSNFHYKVIANLKNISLPMSSTCSLEEGEARLELDSQTNKLCLTQGYAKVYQDKKIFCDLQIDTLIGAIDLFSNRDFAGSLQIKELPSLQVKGVLFHPEIDKWQIDCNVTAFNSETWQIQLTTEDVFEQYQFSCLGKDMAISGKKLFSDWHIDQIQVGSLTATGIFAVDEKKLHCKTIEGNYKTYPFSASGMFDLQTHAICGQIDYDSISLKSAPFICEYSVEQGFFSKQIDLTVQDIKSSDVLANLFCHSTSYREKILESTIDFSLPKLFKQMPITWQKDLIGRIEVKKMPGLVRLSGDLKQGDLFLEKQLINHQNTTFSLENTHFMLHSELSLGEKPFWGTLQFEYDKAGVFEISDKPLQPGLKGCFSIEANKCKLHTIKGKACGLTADLEAKEANNLQGTLEINIADCASFISLLEKIIKPLQIEADFIYQGEISNQGCRGLLQAEQMEVKGFSINKFSAGIELFQKELQIHDFRLEDQAGSLFAKTMSCKNLDSWEIWIPEVEIKQLQLNHVLKKAKPFVVDVLVKDMQAQLSDLETLHALGQCRFHYSEQDQFFEIPLDILSKIGLDLRSFMPVEGELEFKIQQSRCYLTQLINTFSRDKHCTFALAKKKKSASYIGFDGSVSIDLQLKQKKLLKLINPFTFTIRGTLDRPKYNLALLKN